MIGHLKRGCRRWATGDLVTGAQRTGDNIFPNPSHHGWPSKALFDDKESPPYTKVTYDLGLKKGKAKQLVHWCRGQLSSTWTLAFTCLTLSSKSCSTAPPHRDRILEGDLGAGIRLGAPALVFLEKFFVEIMLIQRRTDKEMGTN